MPLPIKRLRRWIAALSLAAAAISVGSLEALAGPEEQDAASREEARSLAKEGYSHFKDGEHEKAVELLERAYALYPAPTIALLQARSLTQLGKLVEAAKAYEKAANARLEADATQPMKDAVISAKDELAALRPRIPALSIGLYGAGEGISVKVNGEVVPPASLGAEMRVNPGVYLINAIGPEGPVASEKVTLEEGSRRAVVLRLPGGEAGRGGGAPGRGTGQRVAGWTIVGVGAAGLAVGIGAGVHMMNEKAILDAACTEKGCPRSVEGDLASFRAARTASLIGYGAGIAGLGAGVALLLLAPSREAAKGRPQDRAALASPRVTPWIGLGSAGVKGAF
jgi:hypothetical protein